MNRTSTPSQPETMRMRVLTEGELSDTVQPQDAVFQLPPPETTMIPSYVQSQDAMFQMSPPPQVPETTRMSSSVLTEAGLADINDSSGRIDFNDISLQLEGEPQDDLYSTPLRQMTVEEIRLFVNSSGLIDFDAIALFQRNNPDSFPPQDDVPPPRQPETTSYEAYQSKGLSVRTISKYLKTMSAAEIRARDIDGDRKICAVCLDDVCGQKDTVAILNECGHEFHYCCLKKWLRRKNTCPLCRKTAVSNPEGRRLSG